MYNFLLCQNKTEDKSLLLPEDINRLICQKLVDFVKHENREADVIEMKNYMSNHKWLKDGVLHRELDLPAYIASIINSDSTHKSWWENGKLSRLNNPACIVYSNSKANLYIYAINGIVSKIKLNIKNDNEIITQIVINNYTKIIDSMDKYNKMMIFIVMLMDSC